MQRLQVFPVRVNLVAQELVGFLDTDDRSSFVVVRGVFIGLLILIVFSLVIRPLLVVFVFALCIVVAI